MVTYDSALRNIYLPVAREETGIPGLRWVEGDGKILIWSKKLKAYVAVLGAIAPDGEYVFGRLIMEERVVGASRGDEAGFVRALSMEMRDLSRDLRKEWEKHQ